MTSTSIVLLHVRLGSSGAVNGTITAFSPTPGKSPTPDPPLTADGRLVLLLKRKLGPVCRLWHFIPALVAILVTATGRRRAAATWICLGRTSGRGRRRGIGRTCGRDRRSRLPAARDCDWACIDPAESSNAREREMTIVTRCPWIASREAAVLAIKRTEHSQGSSGFGKEPCCGLTRRNQ
jgi:hypothetical protein